jgi:hypothetical protein
MALTITATAIPYASATPRVLTEPWPVERKYSSAQTAPIAKKTIAKVPMNSAKSFWVKLYTHSPAMIAILSCTELNIRLGAILLKSSRLVKTASALSGGLYGGAIVGPEVRKFCVV